MWYSVWRVPSQILHRDCWLLNLVEGFPQHGVHEGVLIGRTGMLQDRLEEDGELEAVVPNMRAERLVELEENLWNGGWQKINVKILREAVHDIGKIGGGTLQRAQSNKLLRWICEVTTLDKIRNERIMDRDIR